MVSGIGLTRVVMLPVVAVERGLGALDAARGAAHGRLDVVPRVVEGQMLGELLPAREVPQADGTALVARVVGVASVLGLLRHSEVEIKLFYKISHLLIDLGWVDFDLGVSSPTQLHMLNCR